MMVVGCVYFIPHKYLTSSSPVIEIQSDISTWKTYRSEEYGFSIKYPPKYVVEGGFVATSTPWVWTSFMTIYDSRKTLTGEFARTPVQVTLQRQPVKYKGRIFHTITEYYKSGVQDQMIQGFQAPTGKLVTVNGVQAITYHYLPGDAGGGASDSYYFIKNDLIYEFSFDASDPNEKEILESISWQ